MGRLTSPSIRHKPMKPKVDRPGWVPAWVDEDWDENPYAYQTEGELMPAGGLHGQILAYLMELLRHILAKRGLMILLDTFMLFHDEEGVKRRIAPDLMITGWREEPPSAYDLEVEPLPFGVLEVTSPKSQMADKEKKMAFYLGQGIPLYVVIDAVTRRGKPRKQAAEAELALLREKLAQYEE